MANITLKGNLIHTIGNLPKTGTKAPSFSLRKNNLMPCSLEEFAGKNVIINIFPSIDTGTCAASVRNFNKTAAGMDNTVVLCISRDLPFAQARFCGAEGIDNVVMLSDFATGQFGKDYGLEITDSPMAGLHSRCIVVLDEDHQVKYTEQVAETVNEPNYDAAIGAL